MASFSSQTCLTAGKKITKHCFKLLSRNCQQCKPDEKAPARITYTRRIVRLHWIVFHTVQFHLLCVRNFWSTLWCKFFSCVWNTGKCRRFSLLKSVVGRRRKEKCRKQSRTLFLVVSVLNLSMSESWRRLFPARTLVCGMLYQYILYITR